MRPRALAAGLLRPPRRVAPDPIAAAKAVVAELARRDAPVVAGPWLAEVGYELLYWIPFLRWAVRREPSLRERLIVVSRGGVESWYDGIAATYRELYARVEPEELERLRAEAAGEHRGVRKQLGATELDARLLVAVGVDPEAQLLHPRVMFDVVTQLLKRPTGRLSDLPFADEPLSPPRDLRLDLPERFVAVRFYYRASFPDTDANRRFAAAALARVLETDAVVSLHAARAYDDHVDADVPAGIVRPPELDDPARNLAVQAAVLARASAFVGTYGGLAYLPPLYGVPALAYYSEPRFRVQHLERAQRMFGREPYGRLVALSLEDARLVERLVPRLVPGLSDGGR